MSENSSTVPLQTDEKPLDNNDPEVHKRRAELIGILASLTPGQLDLTEKLVMAASKVQFEGGTEAEMLAAVNEAFERRNDPPKPGPVTLPASKVAEDTTTQNLMTLAWALYGQLIDHHILEIPNMHGTADMTEVAEHIKHVTDSIYLSLVGAGLEWKGI